MKRIQANRQSARWMRDLNRVSLKNYSKIKKIKSTITTKRYHLSALKKFEQMYTEF